MNLTFLDPHGYDIGTIFFRNDTLFISNQQAPTFSGKLIKFDSKESLYKELFNDTYLSIQLPKKKKSNEVVNRKPDEVLNLNAGYEKNHKDSVFINQEDLWLRMKDIPRAIEEQKLRLYDRQLIEVHLNCDEKVPQSFIDSVVSIIRKTDSTLKIYK